MYSDDFKSSVNRIAERLADISAGKKTLNESTENVVEQEIKEGAQAYAIGDVVRSRLTGRVGYVRGHALNEHVVVRFNGEPFTRTTHFENVRPVPKG